MCPSPMTDKETEKTKQNDKETKLPKLKKNSDIYSNKDFEG